MFNLYSPVKVNNDVTSGRNPGGLRCPSRHILRRPRPALIVRGRGALLLIACALSVGGATYPGRVRLPGGEAARARRWRVGERLTEAMACGPSVREAAHPGRVRLQGGGAARARRWVMGKHLMEAFTEIHRCPRGGASREVWTVVLAVLAGEGVTVGSEAIARPANTERSNHGGRG